MRFKVRFGWAPVLMAGLLATACSRDRCETSPYEKEWTSHSAGWRGQVTAITAHPYERATSVAVTDEGDVVSASWPEYWLRLESWPATSRPLRDVAQFGSLWAVGDGGFALHGDFGFDPPKWTSESLPTTVNLNAVFALTGSPAAELWIVGDAGTVLHRDGTSFSVETIGEERLLDIWGREGELWVVGEGTDVLYRRTGGAWQRENPALGVELVAVGGFSARDVLFVGKRGAIVRWQGAGFEFIESGVNVDLTAITVGYEAWIAGKGGTFLQWAPQTTQPVRLETPTPSADFVALELGHQGEGDAQTLATNTGLLLRNYWPDILWDACGGS